MFKINQKPILQTWFKRQTTPAAAAKSPTVDVYEGTRTPPSQPPQAQRPAPWRKAARVATWVAAGVLAAGGIAGLVVATGGFVAIPLLALVAGVGMGFLAWRLQARAQPSEPAHDAPVSADPPTPKV